jgi:hypothetical protein
MCHVSHLGRQARRFDLFETLKDLDAILLVGWNPDQGDDLCLKFSTLRVGVASVIEKFDGRVSRRHGRYLYPDARPKHTQGKSKGCPCLEGQTEGRFSRGRTLVHR